MTEKSRQEVSQEEELIVQKKSNLERYNGNLLANSSRPTFIAMGQELSVVPTTY